MAWGHQKPSDAIQDWIDEYKVPNSAFPFIKICQWAKHCQSKLELFQTQCKHQKFWAQNSKSSYVLAKSGDTGTMKRLAGLPLPRWEAFDNCIFYNMCSSIYLRMNCMPFVLMIPVVHSSHTLRKMLTHWFSGVQMIRIVWSMASETLGTSQQLSRPSQTRLAVQRSRTQSWNTRFGGFGEKNGRIIKYCRWLWCHFRLSIKLFHFDSKTCDMKWIENGFSIVVKQFNLWHSLFWFLQYFRTLLSFWRFSRRNISDPPKFLWFRFFSFVLYQG